MTSNKRLWWSLHKKRVVINFTESFINGKPKFRTPQNMKIIPGTQDRVINSPFPFLLLCEKLAYRTSSFPFVFFVFFFPSGNILNIFLGMKWSYLYITTHINPKPQRILRVHLRWILIHSKSGINGNRKWVKGMC